MHIAHVLPGRDITVHGLSRKVGWLHVPTTPEPGRAISEGTVVVWTIFDHLAIYGEPKIRYCGGLSLLVSQYGSSLDINVKE